MSLKTRILPKGNTNLVNFSTTVTMLETIYFPIFMNFEISHKFELQDVHQSAKQCFSTRVCVNITFVLYTLGCSNMKANRDPHQQM